MTNAATATAVPSEAADDPQRPSAPPVPDTLRDLGVSEEKVTDLILKALHVQGAQTGERLNATLGVPFTLIDSILLTLQQRRFIEVRGTAGHGRVGYIFDLTGSGRDRARDALESSQYVGAVPVPFQQYEKWVQRQTIRNVHITRSRISEGFEEMVIDTETFETLGPAINSAKSLFLYGDSGNGKTMIAECIAGMLGGSMYIPYAIEVEGQEIVVYDPVYHRPPPADATGEENGAPSIWKRSDLDYDRRFARVRRPIVLAGGELTLEQLDLQYDPYTKMYQAPFQMKANGGVLIIDDFGRQRVPPRDLLNRWIVPLEKRMDYLTLHTGSKFPVPFDCLLIFATNLDPEDLVEEAFLRRIHYKVNVESPTRDAYTEIFQRCCVARDVRFHPKGIDYLYREFYGRRGIAPRSCHPRDIVDHVLDIARFLEIEPVLSEDLLLRACESYFLDDSDPQISPAAEPAEAP